MCNHDPKTKEHYYVELDLSQFEIYMCECGVLIDYRNKANYDNAIHPMLIPDLKEVLVAFSIKMMEEKISNLKKFLMEF